MLKRTAIVLVGLLCAGLPLRAEIIEQVLVRVNGDILTKGEFEQRQVNALRNRQDLTNLSPTSTELRRAIQEVTPGLILDAVDELLLTQRGRELGYAMGDEQFRTIVDNIKKQNNLEDENTFQNALKQEGMTLADLRRSLERQMLVSRVQQQEIIGRISISEEEARTYYDANRSAFTTPASLMFREILIAVPTTPQGVNVAADEEAREKIASLRERLVAGEPFARLAAESSDSGSKANGGLIGPISDDELAPSLKSIVDDLKDGDISQPLRVARGYQLLRLESRTPGTVKTFEDARGEISDRIGQQKLDVERRRYLTRLRDAATIVWRNDELQKAYELALTRPSNPGSAQ